jgi:phosphatidylserine synthase
MTLPTPATLATVASLALLAHGDEARLDLVYFWAAVLIAITPVLIFGTIGAWVLRAIWRAHHAPHGSEAPSDASAAGGPARRSLL